MKLRAYEIGVKGRSWTRTVHAFSAGKAKYEYLLDLRESWPEISFADLICHAIGAPRSNDEFRRVAEKRGVPFARIGMAVEVDGKRGVITGHNDSSNFDGLFDGWRAPVNFHPNWMTKYFDESGMLLMEFGA